MSELSYEASRINGTAEIPAAHSHTDIKDIFDAMDPTEATFARDDYAEIAMGWEDAVTVFAARIRRSSESAWSGPAAETARQAIGDYAADATSLTPALHMLATRVDNMVAAVLTTKNGMPEVVDDPQSWWNPGDWLDGDGGVGKAEADAHAHMATNYVAPALSVDGQVPVLPQPRDPVAMDDGSTPGDTSTGGNPSGPGGAPTGTGTPSPQTPGEEQPGEQQPTGEETAPGETQPASTDTAGTTPQTTAPGTPGSPAVTPSSTNAGTPSGSPGSPAGTPGLGTPGPGSPGPGQTVSGAPAPAGAPATTAGAKTASGSPGARGGMPMMGAPGAGRPGGGDNDGDRQTPDYLVNEENTRELLGEEAPTIPGGVLGADAPSASPAERPPGY
ncbi:hypothetical protein [Nocardia carnea]|uniref:hypothetical protein n=1 Tax=Nocardia carnea TaxID=37328 RepID=UPI00245891EF|nr:hypothetical protein [Nocardia carnea]